MASFNFYLKNVQANEQSAVQLYVLWANKQLKYSTGISINPKSWVKDKNKRNKGSWIKGAKNKETNHTLKSIQGRSEEVFRRLVNDKKQQFPTPSELRTALDIEFNRESEEASTFFNYFATHIERLKKDKAVKTIKWYENTYNRLKEFNRKWKSDLDFETIDMDFYFDFLDFLREEQQVLDDKGKVKRSYFLTDNTIGKHYQNLIAVLHAATSDGKNKNLTYQSRRFKKPSDESMNIYLDEAELSEMYHLELPERLEKVRDLFLVGCYTGLRFSDLSRLDKTNFKGNFIEIVQKKTDDPVLIPINPIVREIMKRYKDRPNSLPPVISGDKTRKYLREIGELIPSLHEPYIKNTTRGGKKVTETFKKYEMIGTHTARRSFATNLYNDGVSTLDIMKITGHKTEEAFMRYIKTSPKDHALRLQDHWEKKFKLKAI